MQTPFRVGLCLAGAATGGAYSAGVMDFFLEAMAAWQIEKDRGNPNVPSWSVVLTEMVGTSAGGITSTLAVASLNIDHEPLPRGFNIKDRQPQNNPLFATWVKEMNKEQLLNNNDLKPEQKEVKSFLNADFMSNTSAKVLKDHGLINPSPPEWASNVHLCLTATNMRGVPYSINDFHSEVGANEKFFMRRYMDYTEFLVTNTPESVPEQLKSEMWVLDIASERNTDVWKRAIDCSRATSAFPGGFPTVNIETPRAQYVHRLDLAPDWATDDMQDAAHLNGFNPTQNIYSAVDGGVLDNKPFELLEKHMQRRKGQNLKNNGAETWGSIILIDPFPEKDIDPRIIGEGLPVQTMASALFAAMKGQAMFKESAIQAAANPNDMEKFMIRPDRKIKAGQKFPLATGTLLSFGGILDEKIRLHDFELGRRNCKHFLENVFCISRKDALQNPIFSRHREHIKEDRIPIIPVVGSAEREIPLPQWPTYSTSERKSVIEGVMKLVDKRISKSLEIAFLGLEIVKPVWFFQNPFQWTLNQAAKFVHGQVAEKTSQAARKRITHAMKHYVD